MIDSFLIWVDSNLTLTNIANWASIAGLFLSLFLLYSIRSIKKKYIFKGTAPQLQKNLEKHASNLSTYLQDFTENTHPINEELSFAEVNVSSLYSLSDKPTKKRLKILTNRIKKYRKKGNGAKQDVREIYLELNMCIQQIKNSLEEEQWSK